MLDISIYVQNLTTVASAITEVGSMVGALQNLNGLRDLTTQLTRMVYHP